MLTALRTSTRSSKGNCDQEDRRKKSAVTDDPPIASRVFPALIIGLQQASVLRRNMPLQTTASPPFASG